MSHECPTCGKTCASEKGMKQHHARSHGESLTLKTYSCDNCGDNVQYKEYNVKDNESIYCSEECKHEGHQRAISGENNPQWIGGLVDVECAYCGDTFQKKQCRVEGAENTFCSMECKGKYRSENFNGENNPAWKGGETEYLGSWKAQRKKALERDGYRCRACGMSEGEHIERYGRSLDVHHVVPVREFDDPVDANSLGNLVTACKECHGRYEGLPVFPR